MDKIQQHLHMRTHVRRTFPIVNERLGRNENVLTYNTATPTRHIQRSESYVCDVFCLLLAQLQLAAAQRMHTHARERTHIVTIITYYFWNVAVDGRRQTAYTTLSSDTHDIILTFTDAILCEHKYLSGTCTLASMFIIQCVPHITRSSNINGSVGRWLESIILSETHWHLVL